MNSSPSVVKKEKKYRRSILLYSRIGKKNLNSIIKQSFTKLVNWFNVYKQHPYNDILVRMACAGQNHFCKRSINDWKTKKKERKIR